MLMNDKNPQSSNLSLDLGAIDFGELFVNLTSTSVTVSDEK